MHVGFAILFLALLGGAVLLVMALIGLVLVLLLRRKKEPRGFEVITKQ